MCCNDFAERPVQVVATRFLAPLSSLSGATALMVPALAELADVAALGGRLDGLLLTGSRSNLAGHRYGRAGAQGPCDEQRDEVALSLAAHMIERGRPVFGICRGFQELNVLFGGTLRDLEGEAHLAPPSPCGDYEKLFRHEHDIALSAGGLLSEASGRRRLKVTSAHRQGVDRLGRGLAVEAVATDGLVEAFSARPAGAEVLAVQWHPEIAAGNCPVNRSFYRLMGLALRGEPLRRDGRWEKAA